MHDSDWTIGLIWVNEVANGSISEETLTPYSFLLQTENELLNNSFLDLLWTLFHWNIRGEEEKGDQIKQAIILSVL